MIHQLVHDFPKWPVRMSGTVWWLVQPCPSHTRAMQLDPYFLPRDTGSPCDMTDPRQGEVTSAPACL